METDRQSIIREQNSAYRESLRADIEAEIIREAMELDQAEALAALERQEMEEKKRLHLSPRSLRLQRLRVLDSTFDLRCVATTRAGNRCKHRVDARALDRNVCHVHSGRMSKRRVARQ